MLWQTARLFLQELDRFLALPQSQAERDARARFAQDHYSWEQSAATYATVLRGLCMDCGKEGSPGNSLAQPMSSRRR